jgi:flagellin
MGLDKADVTTEDGAKATIGMAKNANSYISSVRSRLGAYQNRLEHTADSLDVTNENVTEAYSRIMDTDMAEEMTEYTNLQVLTQAGTSILAQANERPQQVLQLLQ